MTEDNLPLAARLAAFYHNASVLVTGGLGFIGSNLAVRLHGLGARVTVLDSLNPGQGGNRYNVEEIAGELEIVIADQAEREVIDRLVRGRQVVFNLAGRSAHADSVRDPHGDLHANGTAQLALLEAMREHNPGGKVVYAGTRSQYGRTRGLPVTEDYPQAATDINGANKSAAERYHMVYFAAHGLRTCSLRLTNTYGPRHLMAHARQGFFNWFIRQAMDGDEILVYGDGSQLRDMVYIDDVVDAFLIAGMEPGADGLAFNIGSGEGASVRELAGLAIAAAGSGHLRLVEYPSDWRPVEVGDFVADVTLARERLGWQPSVPLAEGVARTVAFYEPRREHYWCATE